MKLGPIYFDETVEADANLWQEICDSAIAHNFESAEAFAKKVLQESTTRKVSRQQQILHDLGGCLWLLATTKEELEKLSKQLEKLLETV